MAVKLILIILIFSGLVSSDDVIVKRIQDRYETVIDKCVNSREKDKPAYECSGIMIRGVKTNVNLPFAWSMKALNLKKGAFSLAYLRRDQPFSRFPRDYVSGFIIYPSLKTPKNKNVYSVYCSFPLDGFSDYRAGHGCGIYEKHKAKTSGHCDKQNIKTFNKWKSHFEAIIKDGNKKFQTRQCAFDMTKKSAAKDFATSLAANKYIQKNEKKYAFKNNELRMKVWKASPEKLPIEAFFYLHGSATGKNFAEKYQDEFYSQSDGETIPIVSIQLPARNKEFTVVYHKRTPQNLSQKPQMIAQIPVKQPQGYINKPQIPVHQPQFIAQQPQFIAEQAQIYVNKPEIPVNQPQRYANGTLIRVQQPSRYKMNAYQPQQSYVNEPQIHVNQPHIYAQQQRYVNKPGIPVNQPQRYANGSLIRVQQPRRNTQEQIYANEPEISVNQPQRYANGALIRVQQPSRYEMNAYQPQQQQSYVNEPQIHVNQPHIYAQQQKYANKPEIPVNQPQRYANGSLIRVQQPRRNTQEQIYANEPEISVNQPQRYANGALIRVQQPRRYEMNAYQPHQQQSYEIEPEIIVNQPQINARRLVNGPEIPVNQPQRYANGSLIHVQQQRRYQTNVYQPQQQSNENQPERYANGSLIRAQQPRYNHNHNIH